MLSHEQIKILLESLEKVNEQMYDINNQSNVVKVLTFLTMIATNLHIALK